MTRRPNEKFSADPRHFSVCPKCKAFYSKNSIRRHYVKCDKGAILGDKSLQVKSRAVHGQIHKKASFVMKNKIFPKLRDDDVTRIIRYDELAIIFGNKLTEKYRHPHMHKMIRSKLRLIGRLLLEMKKINLLITDYASIFNPCFYDDIIKSVNTIALFNPNLQKYKSPATAFAYGTLLKKCGKILINEYIKMDDEERQKLTKNFISILEEDYGSAINKTVEENQLEIKRQKTVILPSKNDIKKLNDYLASERKKNYIILKNDFDLKAWEELGKLTLVSIQVYNRRRAGEIERLKISDFETYQSLDKNSDYEIYNSLSENGRKAANKYVRFLIRGKKGRTVAVLLHEELKKCVELILKFRTHANVPEDNPYVFGVPSCDIFKHLEACVLLRHFSERCNADIPKSLRGTELRKQIATFSLLSDLKSNEVDDLANFLGHARQVHDEHYRMPVASRDIVRMSQLLRKAQGEDTSGMYTFTIDFLIQMH